MEDQQSMDIPHEPIQSAGPNGSLFSKPLLLGVIVAIVLVAVIVGVFANTNSVKSANKTTTASHSYITPTPTTAVQPVINNDQGLNSALQTVDSENSSFDTDVLQNSQDASTFQ